jgi:hypothetical protein
MLVQLLNKYLEFLYQYQDPAKGYLFRPRLNRPEEMGTRSSFNWFSRAKVYLNDFLTTEQIRNIQFKSSRHTMYNLFDKSGLPSGLEAKKKRAAQIHMRHNVLRKSGTVGDVNYSDEISSKDYLEAVDLILNFPWDLNTLEVWEKERGYHHYSSDRYEISSLYNFNEDEDEDDDESFGTSYDDSSLIDIIEAESERYLNQVQYKNELQEKNEQFWQQEYDKNIKMLVKLRKTSAKKLGVSSIERSKMIEELKQKEIDLQVKLKLK